MATPIMDALLKKREEESLIDRVLVTNADEEAKIQFKLFAAAHAVPARGVRQDNVRGMIVPRVHSDHVYSCSPSVAAIARYCCSHVTSFGKGAHLPTHASGRILFFCAFAHIARVSSRPRASMNIRYSVASLMPFCFMMMLSMLPEGRKQSVPNDLGSALLGRAIAYDPHGRNKNSGADALMMLRSPR
jgi:hypothetical protein